MAGCLLVGDVPQELEPTLGQYMVRLEPDMSDDQIIKTVTWWLEHDDQAQAHAAASRQLAREMFTMEVYARRFVRAADDFLARAPQPRRRLAEWFRPGRVVRVMAARMRRQR
jgi:hypothetical protein